MTEQSQPGDEQSDPTLTIALDERRQLTNLAYRLLGSLADAEDVVQEAHIRWCAMSREQREAINNPAAWLTRVTSRLCLNVLSSARARREVYVGEWIPEPLPEHSEWTGGLSGDIAVNPADRVTLDESVNMAFLVVLDAMTPAERVAFILHDVFRYPFAEVAEIVGRTPAACRQLASSARRRVGAARVPAATPVARQARVVSAFKRAWEAGDIEAIIALLDPDATAVADGGGLASTVLRPVHGAEQIVHFAVGVLERLSNTTFLERTVNGRPGLVLQQDGATVTVAAFQVENDRITHIWAVRNPEKLRQWTEFDRIDDWG